MWSKMDAEHRKLAFLTLVDEFGLTSEIAFVQNWIYKGRIPEPKQERTVVIFQNIRKQQKEKEALSEL